MNNRKYHYKTNPTPKAWKKKKPSFHSKRTSQFSKWKKGLPAKPNKQLGRKPSTWKLPTTVFLASLIMIILIIPTLIVLPDKDNEQAQISAKTNDEKAAKNKQEEVELTAADSPFSVEVMRANTDNKVEDVPLETYVSRVVASEMPIDFEMEALKAQALAARTYVVDVLLHHNQDKDDQPQVTDTTDNQVYSNKTELQKKWGKDYAGNMEKVTEAVAATKGEILTYDDNPIFPAFFSTSNGYTENSEDYWDNKLPYLRSVKSPWDKKSPKFLDQKIVSIADAEQQLGVQIAGDLQADMSRTDGKRVSKLNIGGKEFTGKEIREKFDLRSSDFTIEQKNGHIIFTTKGFGHGIGMSQYGANGMAKDGKNYKDIVAHYYKGVKISKITETAPTLVAK
ncbi:stage II sporulation protein D [Lentibacillus sp. N15]|uniref:stage II sporulation protein D n=1 Tax=Lentibacillus songyuanensis TaxID=3136161 RepID=UPI0031BB3D6A